VTAKIDDKQALLPAALASQHQEISSGGQYTELKITNQYGEQGIFLISRLLSLTL
jgi:hypothetical protein